jgi:HPt (histidine-containing phosphotransfer) domain-containing protein
MEQPAVPAQNLKMSPAPAGVAAGPLTSQFADDPEMADLVEMFVSELPSRLEAIERAWSAGDGQGLRRMAHQLKGAGSGYGYPMVSEAAAAVEAALLACGESSGASELAGVRAKVEALTALCRRAASGRSGGT